MKISGPAREMKLFLLIWLGQLASITGSALTAFVLGVWVYQQTNSVSSYSLMLLATTLPSMVLAPFAGVLVDRWNRRLTMILSDSGAAVVTLVIALLFYIGKLQIWHLYPLLVIAAALRALQMPAYMAATTLLVPKQYLVRASGLVQISQAISFIVGPTVAGWLIVTLQLSSIILIDFVTFLLALTTLLLVRIPSPPQRADSESGRLSWLTEAASGWRFVKERPGLMSLLYLFALVNFSLALVQTLITPMVLGFAPVSELGSVVAAGSLGMLVGSLVISIWGGPVRKIDGILLSGLLQGTGLMIIGLRPLSLVAASGFFLCMASASCINSLSQVIWQLKTPLEMQGRIFAVRMLIAWSCTPLGYLLAGPLADRLFEPLLQDGGALADTVGRILGVGQGRGMALLIVITGLFPFLAFGLGYLFPRLLRVEEELPDQIPMRAI